MVSKKGGGREKVLSCEHVRQRKAYCVWCGGGDADAVSGNDADAWACVWKYCTFREPQISGGVGSRISFLLYKHLEFVDGLGRWKGGGRREQSETQFSPVLSLVRVSILHQVYLHAKPVPTVSPVAAKT
jgi:hypothetical protein